ncbi:MAG: hypothetical protein A4E29_00406 [Methanomassiliicoccales archaeon PtaB.Bin134]|jgi:uncharacterized protein with PIN domain|nr:MAG: hypothetical protein A4E29_00406 [Methanomassiliicoccales archaeon PtaB.Bin134]
MADPCFMLDGMLGTLARWLRIMGYDSLYVQDADDRRMLQLLEGNQRVLLTRDRQLCARAGPRGFLVLSDDLDSQLEAVAGEFGLSPEGRMTRCSACNGALVTQEKEEVRGDIPEGTWSAHDEFWRCGECGKVYWKGAHWNNIRRRMEELSRGPRRSPR